VEAIESSVRRIRLFFEAVFGSVGKEALNLCSRVAFLTIKKALTTAGFLRLLLSVEILRL
jgi:hypothetical protein